MSESESSENGDRGDVEFKIGEMMYLNEEYADIHFVFHVNGQTERVPAHKCYLAAISDFFKGLFENEWNGQEEVVIDNVSMPSFQEFLRYFYTGRMQLTIETAPEVMSLAKRYEVMTCLTLCEKFLRHELNYKNVCTIFRLAIRFDLCELQGTCEILIGIHAKELLASDNFLKSNRRVVSEILKIDAMACSEVELFEACMNWVKVMSQQEELTEELVQTHFGDLCDEIRFGSMTFEEFFPMSRIYGAFFGDTTEIIQMLGDKNFQPTMINGNRERRSDIKPWLQENMVKCDRLLSKFCSNEPYMIQPVEKTQFVTNDLILFSGFSLNYIYEYHGDNYGRFVAISTEITIKETEIAKSRNETVLFQECMNFTGPKFKFDVPTQPILIRPGFLYTIQMKQKPSKTWCTGGLLKSTVQMDCSATINFFNDSTIEGDPNVARGLIRSLKFYKI